MPSSDRRNRQTVDGPTTFEDTTGVHDDPELQQYLVKDFEIANDRRKQKSKLIPRNHSRGESSKTASRTETAKRDLHPEIFLTKTSKTLTTSDPPSSLEKDGSLHMMLLVMDDTPKKVAKVVNYLKSDTSPAVTAKDVMKTYAHIMFAEGGYSEHGVRFQRAEPEREKMVKDFRHNVRMIDEAGRHGSHLKVVKGLLEPDISRGR